MSSRADGLSSFHSPPLNTTDLLTNHSEIHIESSYFESPVVLGDNGEIKSAIYVNLTLLVLKIISCSLGIPLNLIAILLVLFKQNSNTSYRPRDVFSLATLFSNLLMFFPAHLEIAYFFYPANKFICVLYVATAGLPEVFISQSNILSLIDRLVAIQFPLWHIDKVTVPWSILWVIVSFVVAVFVNKFLYVFQLVELDCHIHLVANRIPIISVGVLFTLCLTLRVTVFFQTRKLIRLNEDLPADNFAEAVTADTKNINLRRKNTLIDLQQKKMNEETLRRIEDETTKTVISGVTMLLVFTFPRLIFPIVITVCKTHYHENYRVLVRWVPYFKQLGPFSAMCHPIVHLYFNTKTKAPIAPPNNTAC